MMGHHGVWPIYVIIFLTSLSKCSISLPIHDQEEPRLRSNNLTEYDTARHVGRTLKASDWDSCEFGDTLTDYDESCPNGARGIIPCNPGQLKVDDCIGEDGDRSRVCDPCPQKFYQRYYNRCTECHPCSECGPNEQIKQPCTDETDTDCESIIPPDPVPTTPPKPTSTPPSPASAQTATDTPGTTTDVSSVTTKSTSALTYMNADTTQVPVLSTTLAEKIVPIATSKGISSKVLHIAISAFVLFAILLLVVPILLAIIWKLRAKIRKLRSCTCQPHGNDIPMKKRDSGLPSSSAPSNVNTPENEYACQEKSCRCAESGQMQRTGEGVLRKGRPLVQQVNADTESDTGSLPRRRERQEPVQSSVGDDGNESQSNMESHDRTVPDSTNLSNDDLCRDGNGGRHQDSEPKRTTVVADMHVHTPPENTDTHRDALSRTEPSPNYENLPGQNQTNIEAPSTSGGGGSEDSDGSCVTGPELDDGDAIADPPRTLHSTTPRPQQEGLPEADPLMQQQASPEVVPKMKKDQKRKGIMGILNPGRKMFKKVYSAVPPEDSSLSSKADEMVSEDFLDDLADHIDLKTLDKLCRQIGLSDKDVSNNRITYQQLHGRELAFRMFMSIRAKFGITFTYRCTIRAMKRSSNSHLVEEFIVKYSLS